jgi:hypothetical protein
MAWQPNIHEYLNKAAEIDEIDTVSRPSLEGWNLKCSKCGGLHVH